MTAVITTTGGVAGATVDERILGSFYITPEVVITIIW